MVSKLEKTICKPWYMTIGICIFDSSSLDRPTYITAVIGTPGVELACCNLVLSYEVTYPLLEFLLGHSSIR